MWHQMFGGVMKWKGKGKGIINIEVLPNRYDMVVYCIKDPDTLEVRGVGRTTNVIQRYSDYAAPDLKKNRPSPRDRWVIELATNGKKPLMEILAICPDEGTAKLLEPLWDYHLSQQGNNLLNADRYPVRVIRLVDHVMKKYKTMEERTQRLIELYNQGA